MKTKPRPATPRPKPSHGGGWEYQIGTTRVWWRDLPDSWIERMGRDAERLALAEANERESMSS